MRVMMSIATVLGSVDAAMAVRFDLSMAVELAIMAYACSYLAANASDSKENGDG